MWTRTPWRAISGRRVMSSAGSAPAAQHDQPRARRRAMYSAGRSTRALGTMSEDSSRHGAAGQRARSVEWRPPDLHNPDAVTHQPLIAEKPRNNLALAGV